MTNEEAIKEVRDASDSEVRYGDTEYHYDKVMKRVEAFDMAIKALEQARPKGKWKPLNYKDEMWGYVYKCSNCGAIEYGGDYCPDCGADMRESEENTDETDN